MNEPNDWDPILKGLLDHMLKVDASDLVQPAAVHRLKNRGVFRVDRQDAHVAALCFGDDDRAGDDERFLVREGNSLSRAHRREHRLQPRRPDDGRQDDVDVAARHHLC